MTSTRQHGDTDEPSDPNPAPETSYAERAKTLIFGNRIGVLSTQSQKCPGFPFGSTMPYALDAVGRPLLLISSMAMHTKNIRANQHVSLFVADATAQGDPLGAARLTLVGKMESVPEGELTAAREAYLALHENAKYYVDFADFSFWRLDSVDLYYVGGFGVMGWIAIAEFEQASPDPLADASPSIIEHMNQDHAPAMLEIARHEKGVIASEARMTAVDRLGFHLRLKTPERVQSVRIGFPSEVRDADACRQAFITMVQQARKQPS